MMKIKSLQELNSEFMQKNLYHANTANAANTAEKTVHAVPLWKELSFLILKIASILLIAVLLFTFMFGFVRYQEPHMDPAIKDGDLVLFYRHTKGEYLPGDTVVLEFEGQKQVRRVIATAGDIVDIAEGGLYINGALQQEAEIYQRTERYADGIDFPLTVPEGQVFL